MCPSHYYTTMYCNCDLEQLCGLHMGDLALLEEEMWGGLGGEKRGRRREESGICDWYVIFFSL